MRLLFLSSGLEPGRDGVGDYTRLLAQTCAEAGHAVALCSVCDPAVGAPAAPPSAPAPGRVSEWRLPDLFGDPAQAAAWRRWVAALAPEWVSVQHSAFGFHPRGLGRARAAALRRWLPPATRRHLMLHEIWIGIGPGQTLRHRLLGRLQRGVVRAWAGSGFQPHLLHTQCRWNQSFLRDLGLDAAIWPLFGNIPVTAAGHGGWLREHARADAPPPATAFWLGHFGSFYTEEWDAKTFIDNFNHQIKSVGRSLVVVSLGRPRTGGEAWRALARQPPAGVIFVAIPELPPAEISRALAGCDAALCTTPWPLVEKSGAVAAWRMHGVPVLVPRTKTGARAAGLPPWPDPGLFPAFAPPIVLPPPRVAAPDFLDPARSAARLVATFAETAARGFSCAPSAT